MKTYHNLSNKFTNWEVIALIAIKEILVGTNLTFSRSELMTYSKLENARKFLIFFNYKDDPQQLESTMQRTIQNLRDKKLISFLDNRGEYKLTNDGKAAIDSLKPWLLSAWKDLKNISVSEVQNERNDMFKKKTRGTQK
jgi:hypothetical protein